jgi:shikimate kinase
MAGRVGSTVGEGAQLPRRGRTADWTLLTNHAHVLIYLARQPDVTLRRVADAVGITERAVQRIVAELEQAGILSRLRSGRRNVYEIHAELPLRHPIESHRTVQDLLDFVNASWSGAAPRPPRRASKTTGPAARRRRG